MDKKKVCDKLRKDLINSIVSEFSEIDKNTGEIPKLEVILAKVCEIYNEDMKMVMDAIEKKKRDDAINKYSEKMKKKCIENYADYYELNVENVSIHDIFSSSAGIRGWAENYGN